MVIYTDKKELLEILEQNGYSFQFASNELKNDKEIVMKAVKNYGLALEYASETLKNNSNFLLECIKINHEVFNLINYDFKSNMDFIIKAFLINPKISFIDDFKYNNCEQSEQSEQISDNELSGELTSDSFWIQVINQNKSYIQYLPDELKIDENFISLFT